MRAAVAEAEDGDHALKPDCGSWPHCGRLCVRPTSRWLGNMRRTFALLVLMVAGSAAPGFALERGCNAGYRIDLLGSIAPEIATDIVVERFIATGQCGSFVGDRCRERAKGRAIRCARGHWQQPDAFPSDCRIADIHGYLTYVAAMGPREAMTAEALSLCYFIYGANNCPAGMRAKISVKTWGKSGCNGEEELGEIDVSPGALTKGRITVSSSVASSIASQARPIQTQVVTYAGSTGLLQSSGRSVFFQSVDGQLHAPRYRDYYGCGRHAAQHVLDWTVGPIFSFGEISHNVLLFAGTITRRFTDEKAVVPRDLVVGLNSLLAKAKQGSDYKAKITRITDNNRARNFILDTISREGPVVALVQNGGHWVTVMGHWAPVLAPPEQGYFYTFSNGDRVMKSWSYFNLDVELLPLELDVLEYVSGTMINIEKR